VKLSAKLLSGLALVALVAVAVIGLSQSASAAADGKVYVTNVASTLTNEASPPTGRTKASTVYGTYASAVTTGTSARDIVASSNKFIVTVIDSDLNTSTTVTSGEAPTGLNGYAVDSGAFNAAGETITVILTGSAASPIVGVLGDIVLFDHGTSDTLTGVSVKDIIFAGNGVNPPIVKIGIDFGTNTVGTIDFQYPTSAVNVTTASIKSVVDPAGSVITLTETGRNTGRFEGYVTIGERTATFTTGANGGAVGSPATIAAIGGPITVKYVDAATSGAATKVSRTTTLSIDVTVPTATISSPATASESQNRLPTFGGIVTDTESGLDVSAFALLIHLAADKTNTTPTIASGASNAGLPTINGTAASIDVSALKDGVGTLNFSHTQAVILPTGLGSTVPDHIVDFQVRAADLAGNYGYSDADTAKGNIQASGRHGNQPHTIKIDQVIPQISSAASGIGLDTTVSPSVDKANVRDVIKVTFDGKVKEDSISASDFSVVLSKSAGTFVPASIVVKGAVVYLDLDSTIPSDNKPVVKVIGTIEDLAGNSTAAGSATATDELAPVITVVRSGGSGTGTGGEAADSLTKDKMTITVTSDEDLQGPPAIFVTDLVATPTVGNVNNGTLGVAQGSNVWKLVIAKGGSPNGSRAVKVMARDSGSNEATVGKDTVKAYTLDKIVETPLSAPTNAGTTSQSNPFLTTDFTAGGTAEQSSVSVVSATLDAVDVTSSVVASADSKTFFYQTTTALTNAKHKYILKVKDAAGNTSTTTTEFTKADRKDFVITLFAGWNSVSFPSNPLDTGVDSVLSNAGIKQVVAYDATTPSQPWRIASKVDAGSYTSQTTPGLTSVTAGPGYWVETSNFEDQAIALEGPTGPGDARPGLTTIATGNGWNLVGVVDQSRVQTQKGDKGASLKRPNATGTDVVVTSGTYFNTVKNGRAYTFDTVTSKFREQVSADTVTVGAGIWVFISPQDNGQLPHIVP